MSQAKRCHICSDVISDKTGYCMASARLKYFNLDYTPLTEASTKTTYRGPNLGEIFSQDHYQVVEGYAIRSSLTWKRAYQPGAPWSPIYPDEGGVRYHEWLNVHKHTIHALEAYFQNKLRHDKIKTALNCLILLWPFLPMHLSKDISWDQQKHHVHVMTTSTTITQRQDIDKFLVDLGDDISRRVTLRPPKHLIVEPKLVTCFKGPLLKRLLLQTPLMFWPAIFESGITTDHDYPDILQTTWEMKRHRDLDTRVSTMTIDIKNTHSDGGYEVLFLWEQLLTSTGSPLSSQPAHRDRVRQLRLPIRVDGMKASSRRWVAAPKTVSNERSRLFEKWGWDRISVECLDC